tara:strand:- start:82787 stop:84019 length:1233 start_codon:yes stop_codon:yes gene_type:complete
MDKTLLIMVMFAFTLATGVIFYGLHVPKICNNRLWKAMVTPLSSIIGSGFLIATPLMYSLVGGWSLIAMPILLLLAYWVGYAIRFNIMHVEPLLVRSKHEHVIRAIEILVSPALAFAYIISVTYYLKILSAFVMRAFGIDDEFQANLFTTMVLFALTMIGRIDGLDVMEQLERYAVGIKLAIIGGLLAGLMVYNIETIALNVWMPQTQEIVWDFDLIAKLLGMFVIAQGFETSRYLGSKYTNVERVLTMKYAQLITGCIFVTFTCLVYTLSADLVEPSGTAIIDMLDKLSPILGYIMVFAAIMSQFGAATADKVGCSSLVSELSEGRISIKSSFLIIGLLAIILTWTSNVFGIISLASRAFAFYYCLQTLQSCLAAYRMHDLPYRYLKIASFAFLSVIMLSISIFSLPVM